MPVHLPLLSNSSLTTFRRCAREYQYRYVLLRKPRRKTKALQFGSLFHAGLNAWWRCAGPESSAIRLMAALFAIDFYLTQRPPDEPAPDPFDLVKAECLLAGYTARWGEEGYETLAVEKQFRLPLHTGTLVYRFDGVAGCTVDHVFDIGGAIDAIASRDGIHNVEHKTTASDISEGADYWRHIVALDSQVSTYTDAARRMGFDVRDTLYDVIRKPDIEPMTATPEESRKYTRPTKASPVPRLYASQREENETLDEYRERLTEDIVKRPEWYFQRKTIVRLDHDHVQHARDVAQTAEMIAFAMERDAWPRTPGACVRYHRLCEYHDVCAGLTGIDNDDMFTTKGRPHEELSI